MSTSRERSQMMRDKLSIARAMLGGLAAAALLGGAGAAPAGAAFGEDYGLLPINSGPGTADVPALADVDGSGSTIYDHFFWAGTCDRAAAPQPGDPDPISGGLGTLPPTVEAPRSLGLGQGDVVNVPAPATPAHCIDWRLGVTSVVDQPTKMWTVPPSWRLGAVAVAGAHPDGSTTFAFDDPGRGGNTDNIVVQLPPGFVGNPNAVPKCTADQFAVRPQQCSPQSQVGVLTYRLQSTTATANFTNSTVFSTPVFNLEPRDGNTAELGLVGLSNEAHVTARIVAEARTASDFGVTAFVGQLPSALPLYAQAITLWGVPWASHNDVWRAPKAFSYGAAGCNAQPETGNQNYFPYSGLRDDAPPFNCQQHYDPSWGPIRPFLSNETDCNQAPVTRLLTDSYQFPGPFSADGDPIDQGHPSAGNWRSYDSPSPAVTDCGSLPFAPSIDFRATDGVAGAQRVAGAPAGLRATLSVPQNNEPRGAGGEPLAVDGVDYVERATSYFRSPAGRATSHLKDSVVTLPPGFTVNPSGAKGLEGCSDAQIGISGRQGARYLFNDGDPFNQDGGADGAECPDGSKIGTARVRTPLLEDPLLGDVVLGTPESTDPRSGGMLRLFIVVRDHKRGLVAKIFGSTTADGNVGGGGTGRLTATFVENPEVPFDDLELEFKGGPQAMLAMPQTCGMAGWNASFTPWSSVGAPVPVPAIDDAGQLAVDEGCAARFVPELRAGADRLQGGGSGSFSFHFWREDGEQWFEGLSAKLPKGFLASVRDVTLCTDGQAAAGACPADSKIGVADAKAGAGDPFVLEEKGEVFLTEGYKGAPYGLAVKVRAIAGPFRGDRELSPVIVRQRIEIDPATAQATVVSDPLPLVHHGVPLRVREVNVIVDRARFTRNPTSCSAKQIRGSFAAADGATYDRLVRFQATGCAGLRFKPTLAMRLKGRRQMTTGRHPGLRAVVTQRPGEAGIRRAVVRLPLALALDPDNAQALCEYEDGIKADIEDHCPKGSIVGRATAVSPLLRRPLAGDVYFVKNVRVDKWTGSRIRTLPMIVVALRGEVAVNLRGTSSVKGRKLVNTFAAVPDAPVSRFAIDILGGRKGILAVTRTSRGLIDLCGTTGRLVAEADIDGHNRRRYDHAVAMRKPCAAARRSKKR